MLLRCLSLTQPYASLVAIGAKCIETRSWSTAYRGRLAIHAARGFPGWARARCAEEPFRAALQAHGLLRPDDLPRGAILALVTLADCRPIAGPTDAPPDERERAFGDYTPGRYAWYLSEIQRLDEPLPARGRLGLWRCELRLPYAK